MNPPLEVVRRQDGTMGDIYGRPVIVVFDSNPNHAARRKLLFDNANEREALYVLFNWPIGFSCTIMAVILQYFLGFLLFVT
jgi:hypothetical protein